VMELPAVLFADPSMGMVGRRQSRCHRRHRIV
jgi:hypothetical protein